MSLPVCLFEFDICEIRFRFFFKIWGCTSEKWSSPHGSRALWRRPTVIGDFFRSCPKTEIMASYFCLGKRAPDRPLLLNFGAARVSGAFGEGACRCRPSRNWRRRRQQGSVSPATRCTKNISSRRTWRTSLSANARSCAGASFLGRAGGNCAFRVGR